jgi:hypothetical protein
MNSFGRQIRACAALGVAGAIAFATSVASASVINTSAVLSTTVEELIDSASGSMTTDSSETLSDLSNVPLRASGILTSTDLDGVLVSQGQAFGDFLDPARLDQPNPEEFALEVASYAQGNSVAYSVSSVADESRTVSFSASEVDFNVFGTQTVESRIFLSGAMLIWSTQPGLDLNDLRSEVAVLVFRDDTEETLFSSSLVVSGAAEPTVQGPIQFDVVALDELAAAGVDSESLAILERVEREGSLTIVVIPEQEHPYTYRVVEDQPLVLHARFETRAQNKPGGTGAAVALGRPFQNLAAFMGDAIPGVNGTAMQRAVNLETASRNLGVIRSADSSSELSGGAVCGALGVESVAVLGLVFVLGFTRSRRGWSDE